MVQREHVGEKTREKERERDRWTRGRVWLQRDGAQPCTGERKSGRTSLKVPLARGKFDPSSLCSFLLR